MNHQRRSIIALLCSIGLIFSFSNTALFSQEKAATKTVRWSICEVQVKKIVAEVFKQSGHAIVDEKSKPLVTAEPLAEGYKLLSIEYGKEKIDGAVLKSMQKEVYDLLAKPSNTKGDELYCHDMVK